MKLNFSVKFKSILIPLLFVVLFISLILIIKLPIISQVFEYNLDEGYNIIKSSLLLKGFSLYREIWSNQPPLFTLILSYWFKLFGPSVHHGRLLILIFSGIFLWAFYQTIKNLWGSFCAFTAVVFLILSAGYLRLSVSIMIGIPALALAMLSIYYATLYKKSYSKHLLILSGIFIALSLQTKFFTAFLIPIIALEIVYTKKRFLSPLLLWLGSLLAVYLAIVIIFFHLDFRMFIQQLFQPHLKQIIVPGDDFSTIWRMILTDYDIALLALVGIISLIRKKKWQLFFPVLWLVIVFIILLKWRPIWYHYYLLVSIPICWLAAIGIKGLLHLRKNHFIRWLTIAIIALFIFRLPVKWTRMVNSVKGGTSPQHAQVMNLLFKYRPITNWMFTDRPIFAFYANMLVPPELDIITEKRDFTENITQDYCINKLQEYRPELILLNDLKYYGPKVLSYIKGNYINIYQGEILEMDDLTEIKLYIWKNIVNR